MRLLFRILWIDDQPEQVDAHIFNIEPGILEEGFRLDVVKVTSLEQALGYISTTGIILDNIDLVLIDYHLDGDADGDVVAREIRKRVPFKDIVFYSSDALAELQRTIFEQNVEGVYCAHREELNSKIRGLFRDIIRKVVDLEHTRGIVMGATTDYEQFVTEAISSLDGKISDEHREELLSMADEILAKAVNDVEEVRRKLGQGKSFAALMKHFQFSAAYRIDLAVRMLKLHFKDEHLDLGVALAKYREETMPKRNVLGHKRIHVKGTMSELRGGEKPFTPEELVMLRKELVEYIDHFERLAAIAEAA